MRLKESFIVHENKDEQIIVDAAGTFAGMSMWPLLKPGRDTFTVRLVERHESYRKWDVVLYKRLPDIYVLHALKSYPCSFQLHIASKPV